MGKQPLRQRPAAHWPHLTSQQLLDVLAGVRGGELVHDVQRRLVVGVPDVHVDAALPGRGHGQGDLAAAAGPTGDRGTEGKGVTAEPQRLVPPCCPVPAALTSSSNRTTSVLP